MDDIALDDSRMPRSDIESHLRYLRQMQPATDPEILAKATERGKAVAPAFCELAHAFANCVDAYRANGYSAGEVVAMIQVQIIEPISDLPIIETSAQ